MIDDRRIEIMFVDNVHANTPDNRVVPVALTTILPRYKMLCGPASIYINTFKSNENNIVDTSNISNSIFETASFKY